MVKSAVPSGEEFMKDVSKQELYRAYEKERVSKGKLILQACCLRKSEKNLSMRGIGRRIGVRHTTVRNWLIRMNAGGLKARFDKKHTGRKRILTEDAKSAIIKMLNCSPQDYGFVEGSWQLSMVAAVLKKECNVKFKTRTLQRTLHDLGFTYRKSRQIPEKSASPEEQEAFKAETNRQLMRLKDEGYAILSQDEAGVKKWSPNGRGWRRKGGDDTTPINFSTKSIKMLGVLGEDGYHIQIADSLNSDTFIEFLKSVREKYKKFALVLDNAAYHKSKKVNNFIESTNGDIVAFFLPPHTPQLNPIEVQWRELKRLLAGRCFSTLDDLKSAAWQIISKMSPVKLMSYMTTLL